MGYVSKKDLIDKLVTQYDYEEDKLTGMTKEELTNLLDNLEEEEMKVEEVNEVNGETNEPMSPPTPSLGDYEWHDYAMTHFHKDELIEGNPSVDGMRRVCELLIGEILETQTSVVGTPNEGNQYRASVVVSVVIDDGKNIKKFDGAADAFSGNAEQEYARHALALAETRAEGRALKRALRLRKVVSAEEIVDSSKIENVVVGGPNKIVDTQVNFVDLLAKNGNINVEKLVKSLYNEVDGRPLVLTNIRQLTYDQATALCTKLSEYRNKPDSIPEDIKGYKAWMESFG